MAEIHDDIAAEKAAHEPELRTLDRPTIRAGASTPWGMAQVSRRYADGIILHSTAGHGGFYLDEIANAVVHPLYRNDDSFYEEDCEWAKVAHAFPQLFTAYERNLADRTLRDTYPDAYERVMSVTLKDGQSHIRKATSQRLGGHRSPQFRSQARLCRVHRDTGRDPRRDR